MSTVLDVLRHRLNPVAPSSDEMNGAHIALIMESGGLRAASVGGMAAALEKAGLLNLFDSVHGSSAGACAGAYLVARQTDLGEKIFTQHLPQKSVIRYTTAFKSPAIVNTDLIVDHIMTSVAPLNTEAVLNSAPPLFVTVSNRKTGKAEVISKFDTARQFMETLRATLRIPGPRETGVSIGAKQYVDGGVTSSIPVQSAVAAGATHVVILCAQRPRDYSPMRIWGIMHEVAAICLFHGRRLARGYINGIFAASREVSNPSYGFNHTHLIMRDNSSPGCSVFSRDTSRIARVWNDGVRAGEAFVSLLKAPDDGLPPSR